jgi:hypothetical protein
MLFKDIAMSKLLCLCGHTIVDQTDFLPYKAYFIADEDNEDCFQTAVKAIEKFVLERERGKLGISYGDKFAEAFSKDSEVGDFINYVLTTEYFTSHRHMYECENCGRIWLQARDKGGDYFSYYPEREEKGILRSIHKDLDEIQE